MPGILIVEDERILAADLEERLTEMGYQVCARVGSGEQAVEEARDKAPDLVLMDIKLEGAMDGIEAAGIISGAGNTPVVYLTAFSDQAILDRAKVTGPFGYLVKPFQPRELHSTIEMALRKAKAHNELKDENQKLQQALGLVKQLSGLLPICSRCKRIRDSEDNWRQLEEYISEHSEAEFTHSICPDCAADLYPELYGRSEQEVD